MTSPDTLASERAAPPFVGWIGWALLSVGAGTLALWALPGVRARFSLSPAPLYPNEAIGLIGLAAGLLGLAYGRRALALLGGGIAAAVGGVTLIQYLSGTGFGIDRALLTELGALAAGERFPGRMTAASALSLLLAGISLLTLTTARSGAAAILAGILGVTVATLGGMVVVGYATGMLAELRSGFVAGMAPVGALAYAGIGASLVAVAWDYDRPVATLPRWFAPAVTIACLTATFLVWRALVTRDTEQLSDQLVHEAVAARQALRIRIDALVKSLGRLAARTEQLSAPEWTTDAERMVRDVDAYRALVWTGPDGATRQVVPTLTGDAELARRYAEQATTPVDTVVGMHYVNDPLSAAVLDGGRLLAVQVAACLDGQCEGRVLALFDLDRIFAATLDESGRYGCVTVASAGRELRHPRGTGCRADRMAGHAFMAVGSQSWTITVQPTTLMLAASGSTLPTMILLLGIVVSGLLGASLRLAQRSWWLARRMERAEVSRALQTATDGVWEWAPPDGPMRRGAMWRGLGYPESGPADRAAWASLIHPDDAPHVAEAIGDHLAGKTESLTMEYRVRAADGAWHWIVDRARVVEWAPFGEPSRVLGIYADITERHVAAEAVRASERRFRAIFDSAFQLQILLNLDYRLLEANRTALDLAGVRLEDVRGRRIWSTPWWVGSLAREARLRRACSDAAGGRTVQYREALAGTRSRTAMVEFSLKPIRDESGRVVQLLAEGRDVTERERAERALRELDTLSTMGRLAARVAHEINNPLAGIQNSFMLIKDAVPETHPYHDYVGAIEREIDRIASVTRQLYGLYRAERGDTAETAIGVAMSDAVGLLNQVNRRSNVRIETDLGRAPSTLPLPDALVRQIAFNLVQNAVEASPPGGVVRVTIWTDDGACWLSVRDQGPGVPAELRERIFTDFYSTKTGLRTGGMGLGLSIVRRSVQALGGTITVQNPADGGAEILVRLPITSTGLKSDDDFHDDENPRTRVAGRRRADVPQLHRRPAPT